MPNIVRDLPNLTPTSSGSASTIAIGHLDDASSITIFLNSTASAASTGANPLTIQVSQFDPLDVLPQPGVSQSSAFFNVSSSNTYSTGTAISLTNISFRGLRLTNLTSAPAGDIIAYVSKQISV